MNTKKMIAVMAVLAMAVAAFAFAPVGGISGDNAKVVEMKGDFTSELTLTGEQTVVVVDDLNIIAGGQLTILGDFIVKEGKTVTIEGYAASTLGDAKYSKLMIYGNATIDGNIVSKVTGGLVIEPGTNGAPAGDYTVTINGNIDALGDTSGKIAENVICIDADPDGGEHPDIIVNGTVTVGTNANAYFDDVFFTEGSKFIMLGEVEGDIYLAGYAYFDGAIEDNTCFGIYFANEKAVVDIVSVSCKKDDDITRVLFVTDYNMYAYAYGGSDYYVDGYPYYASDEANKAIDENFDSITGNWFYLANVTNLKFTEKITTSIEYNEDDSKNYMVAAT